MCCRQIPRRVGAKFQSGMIAKARSELRCRSSISSAAKPRHHLGPLPPLILPNLELHQQMRPEEADQRHIRRVAPPGLVDPPDAGYDVPRVEACATCRRCGGQAGAGRAGMSPHGRHGGLPAQGRGAGHRRLCAHSPPASCPPAGGGADAFLFRAEDSVQGHGAAGVTAGHRGGVIPIGWGMDGLVGREHGSADRAEYGHPDLGGGLIAARQGLHCLCSGQPAFRHFPDACGIGSCWR